MKKTIPSYLNPLPILQPQIVPIKVLNLCRQQAQLQTLNLTSVPQLQDESMYYRTFEKQQCKQCSILLIKLRTSQQTMNKLVETNQQLQKKILVQDERLKKQNQSDRNSASSRSKYIKPVKKIPTIEVKVPNQIIDEQMLLQDSQTESNKPNQQISFFQQQIQKLQLKIKELNQQNLSLKDQLINNSEKQKLNNTNFFRDKVSAPVQNLSGSHFRLEKNQYQGNSKTQTPYISDFSPLRKSQIKEVAQTVKKDFVAESTDRLQIQIKLLKNEILYKNLLLDQIKGDHAKQAGVLKRHLFLSVQQSRKIADETTSVLNQFKSELIVLTKQLQASKNKCMKLQAQLNKYRLDQDQLHSMKRINNQSSLQTGQLLEILKTRRSEHLWR